MCRTFISNKGSALLSACFLTSVHVKEQNRHWISFCNCEVSCISSHKMGENVHFYFLKMCNKFIIYSPGFYVDLYLWTHLYQTCIKFHHRAMSWWGEIPLFSCNTVLRHVCPGEINLFLLYCCGLVVLVYKIYNMILLWSNKINVSDKFSLVSYNIRWMSH